MGVYFFLSNTIHDTLEALPALASCDNLAKSARDNGLCGYAAAHMQRTSSSWHLRKT